MNTPSNPLLNTPLKTDISMSSSTAGYVPTTVAVPVRQLDTRSESIDKLANALSKAQSVITFAAKDTANPFFKSKYADLASVWEACRAALTANELSVTQLPSADGAKVTLRTMLIHSSGQYIASDLTMTAAANTPQAIGSTVTYARRYALSAMVGVAQDDDDGNAASKK